MVYIMYREKGKTTRLLCKKENFMAIEENRQEHLIFRGSIDSVSIEELERNIPVMHSRHMHNTVELYLMIGGGTRYYVEQDYYDLSEHTGILIPANTIHRTGLIDEAQPYQHRLLMQFDEATFLPILKTLGFDSTAKHITTETRITTFTPEHWKLITRAVEPVYYYLRNDEAMTPLLVKQFCAQILLLFLHSYEEQKKLSEPRDFHGQGNRFAKYPLVRDVCIYLEEHCGENITIDELAEIHFVCRSKLTNNFKAVTGFTVNEYQNYLRVQKAQLLLRDPGNSVTDIAAQLGYGNVTYFDRAFKRATTMTPLQYRKANIRFMQH